MKKLIALSALFIPMLAQNAQAYGTVKDAIYAAAKAGDTRLIESYLQRGYSIDETDANGNTALCTASWDYDPYAYDLLLSYGANANAKCMKTDEEKVSRGGSNYDGYLIGGGIALGVGGLVALSVGGGGGGGGDTPGPGPGPEPGPVGPDIFADDIEFNSTIFQPQGATNFLAAINAGPAFNKFYYLDETNHIVSKLSNYSTVGVFDTGVEGSHSEFYNGVTSKVNGYNFDYGPCRGDDRKNCWLISKSFNKYYLTFYDKNEHETDLHYLVDEDEYDEWEAAYPADYDWDVYRNMPNSYYPISTIKEDPLNGGPYAHGTHIAGIIGAVHNGGGMLGVSFTNTNIKAVRWDFLSSVYEPLATLVDDEVLAINLSIGTKSGDDLSSKDIDKSGYMMTGWKEAAAYTINHYDTSKSTKDGTIWVKAAGNDGYDYPDIESGIKLVTGYSNLMMLVVVNAKVTLNSDNTVKSYKLDSTSNHCGNTSGYCIAAPGDLIASADIGGGYVLMGGTSMAAPMVTGAISFLKNAFPSMTSEQIVDLLMNTANKNAPDYDPELYGAGLLDLGKAVEYQSPIADANAIVTVSGDDLGSSQIRLDDSYLTVSTSLADGLRRAIPQSITAFDAYDRPYEFSTENYIQTSHASYKNFKNDVEHIIPNRKKEDVWQNDIHFAYSSGGTYAKPLDFMMAEYKSGAHTSGIYFSENTKYKNKSQRNADLNNPFMAFNSAYGYTYNYKLNRKVSFNFEVSGGENGLYDGDSDYNDARFKKAAYGFNSGIDYKYRKNLKFGVTSGILHENDALLGTNGENAFGLSGGQTYHFGLNAAWNINPKWTLSGSYYQGYTKAQKFNSDLIRTSDLVSSGYAAELNYAHDQSLNLGFRVSSPLRIESGKVSVDFASGRDIETDTVYRNRYSAGLKPQRREYKFAVYADKEVNDNVSFSSEFDVRVNPQHTNDNNDYRALFGLNWIF